jgi:hypothetical protein
MPFPRSHSHRAFLPINGQSDSHFAWSDQPGSRHAGGSIGPAAAGFTEPFFDIEFETQFAPPAELTDLRVLVRDLRDKAVEAESSARTVSELNSRIRLVVEETQHVLRPGRTKTWKREATINGLGHVFAFGLHPLPAPKHGFSKRAFESGRQRLRQSTPYIELTAGILSTEH